MNRSDIRLDRRRSASTTRVGAQRLLAGLMLVLLVLLVPSGVAAATPPLRGADAPATAAPPEFIERKIALVIGNSGYAHLDPLPNAVNDADAVGETLRQAGFKVILLRDADRKTFEANLRFFAAEADGSDIAVVYYSGHGFQVGGENYLVPVDAALTAPADMEIQTVRLAEVMDLVSQRAKARIFILDSCRNSPFLDGQYWFRENLESATGAGLAEVRSSLNTLVAFSTEPGAVAFDGTGDTSPFSGAIARFAGIPNQEVRSVLSAVRRAVVDETGGRADALGELLAGGRRVLPQAVHGADHRAGDRGGGDVEHHTTDHPDLRRR